MCETPGKMNMHDTVKMYTIVFEIVGRCFINLPPDRELSQIAFIDRIGLMIL